MVSPPRRAGWWSASPRSVADGGPGVRVGGERVGDGVPVEVDGVRDRVAVEVDLAEPAGEAGRVERQGQVELGEERVPGRGDAEPRVLDAQRRGGDLAP